MNTLSNAGRWLALTVLLAWASALTGCSYDYWVRFQYLTAAPTDVVVEHEQVQIPEGIAAAVQATPMRDDDELDEDVSVDLVSRRSNFLGADDGLANRQFVLYGVQPGSTWIDVYFDGNFISEIPATVISP